MDVVKAAREAGSPLASLPPMFTSFSRNGVDAALEFATPATLTQADRASVHALLDENMAPVYGEGWTDAGGVHPRPGELRGKVEFRQVSFVYSSSSPWKACFVGEIAGADGAGFSESVCTLASRVPADSSQS